MLSVKLFSICPVFEGDSRNADEFFMDDSEMMVGQVNESYAAYFPPSKGLSPYESELNI